MNRFSALCQVRALDRRGVLAWVVLGALQVAETRKRDV
jgi:hypothetical protein